MLFPLILTILSLSQVHANDNQTYSLKKKIQFPGNQQPTTFAIRSDDQILAAIYGKPTEPTPKYTIYTGQQFQKTVKNYDFPKPAYNDVSISDSGIYTSQGQNIVKYPFRFQTQFNRAINQQYSSIALDAKTWAYVAKNQNNCSQIEVVYAYKEEIKQVYLDIYSKCNQNITGQLHDLKNGLIAFASFQYLHIIDKNSLKNDPKVVPNQSINLTEVLGIDKIGGISSFYNASNNQSTLFLQNSSLTMYYTLYFNKTSQSYFYRNVQFYHPATKCQFYNDNTCYGFLQNYLIINQNIQDQLINVKYDSNPFVNSLIIAIDSNESLIATHDFDNHIIRIYRIGVGYNFISENKTLNYREQFGNNAQFQKGQFIPGSSQMILKFNFYDIHNVYYTSKICKWNPQRNSFSCIQNTTISDYVYSAYALVRVSPNSSNYRLLVAKYIKNQSQLLVTSYYMLSNQFVAQSFYINPDIGFGIFSIQFTYGQAWDNKFMINIFNNRNGTQHNFYFKITLPPFDANITLEKTLIIDRDNLAYKMISYKNMFVTFQGINNTNNFAIKFYDLQGNLIEFLPNIIYQNCSYLSFNLISRNSFDHLIVERQDNINKVHIMDFYNITLIDASSKKYQFKKRSMFKQSYYNYVDLSDQQKFSFILPQKQVYVHFAYSSNEPDPVRIYKISEIPLKIFKLNNSNGAKFNFSFNSVDRWKNSIQFAYSSTLSTKPYTQNELLYFTINETLYKVYQIFKLINSEDYNQEVPIYSEKIYNPKQQEFYTKESRTMLASSGRHVISLVYTSVSSIAVISAISGQSSWVVWTISNKSIPLNAVDMSRDGLALILKPSAIRLQPFSCPTNVYPYNIGSDSVFDKIYASMNDALLFFSVRSTFFNTNLVGYSSCLLNADALISQIESNTSITQIQGAINSKSSIFVAVNSSTIATIINGNYFFQPFTKFDSVFVSMSIITSNNVIVLRFQDHIFFCSTFYMCNHFEDVKGDQIFAISEETGIMANVKNGQNQTQTIHVWKIQSYDNITSIQNFSLGKGKYSKGQTYTPKVKKLHFSSLGNLYILTTDASSNGFSSVFYSFTLGRCPQNMTMSPNYECICLGNFTSSDVTVNSSQIVVSEICRSCQTNFIYSKQERKCLCPMTFDYNQEQKSCDCLNGNIQNDGNNVPTCVKQIKPNNIWWIILSSILGFFIFVGAFCCFIKKCCVRKQTRESALLSSLRNTQSEIFKQNNNDALIQSIVSNQSDKSQRSGHSSSRSGSRRLQQSSTGQGYSEVSLSQPQSSSRGGSRKPRDLVRERPQEEQEIIRVMPRSNSRGNNNRVMNTESSIY